MPAVVVDSRPLDPAERYFLLLDRLRPMNIVAIAELGRSVEPKVVAQAWRRLIARRAITRVRFDPDAGGQLVLEQASSASDLSTQLADNLAGAQAAEHDLAFDIETGPLVRCAYAEPATGGAALILTIHHSLGDAKTAIWLLQDLLHEIEPGAECRPEGIPAPLHECLPPERRWRERRKEMVALLREIKADQGGSDPAGEIAWHRRNADGGQTGVDRFSLEPHQTAALRDAGRAAGASVQGMLGAALLTATADLGDGARSQRLALTSPADLRPRFAPPAGPRQAGMYVSLLTAAHDVAPDAFADLAGEITIGLRRRLERGEAELFYELTRAPALSINDRGASQVERLITAAPHAVAVSNVGVIDDDGDADWVRSISFSLAPTPNQAAFAAATTYRGRLTVNLATDATRIEPDVPARLARLASDLLEPKPG